MLQDAITMNGLSSENITILRFKDDWQTDYNREFSENRRPKTELDYLGDQSC